MTKAKRKTVPGLQDLIDRPICYYCEKDFEDLAYLIDHQKAKHFKCDHCSRRLNTAGGLNVHMSQVHKEKLEKVANAMEGREKPDLEIFGMEGFPPALLEAHRQQVTNEYFRREAAHRAKTGNPPPGAGHGPENTKRKETIEETKKRLAEFKARKAAEKAAAANGTGSGANTPAESAASPSQPADMDHQAVPGNVPASMPFNAASPHQNHEMGNAAFAPPRPYDIPMHSPYPPVSTYSAFPNVPAASNFRGTSGSPSQPPAGIPPRQNSLPAAPGLPQRPAFDSPNISKETMAMIHSGQTLPPAQPPFYGAGPPPANPYGAPNPPYGMPNAQYAAPYPQNGAMPPQWGASQSPNGANPAQWGPPLPAGSPAQPPGGTIRDQVDELIESVTGAKSAPQPQQTWYEQQPRQYGGDEVPSSLPQAIPQNEHTNGPAPSVGEPPAATPKSAGATGKSSKKKDKKQTELTVLKYSDLSLSPEEKYAARWRALHESAGVNKPRPTETVVDQVGGDTQAVTGPVDDAVDGGDDGAME